MINQVSGCFPSEKAKHERLWDPFKLLWGPNVLVCLLILVAVVCESRKTDSNRQRSVFIFMFKNSLGMKWWIDILVDSHTCTHTFFFFSPPKFAPLKMSKLRKVECFAQKRNLVFSKFVHHSSFISIFLSNHVVFFHVWGLRGGGRSDTFCCITNSAHCCWSLRTKALSPTYVRVHV